MEFVKKLPEFSKKMFGIEFVMSTFAAISIMEFGIFLKKYAGKYNQKLKSRL